MGVQGTVFSTGIRFTLSFFHVYDLCRCGGVTARSNRDTLQLLVDDFGLCRYDIKSTVTSTGIETIKENSLILMLKTRHLYPANQRLAYMSHLVGLEYLCGEHTL